MKKWFEKFLKSLEDANKKNFGLVKMDCCDLNRKDNHARTLNSHNSVDRK